MKKIILLLLACAFIQPAFSAEAPVIVVMRSRIMGPYNEALSGFEEGIKKSGQKVSNYYNFEDIKGKESKVADEIRNLKPDLIFAIGTEATLFAKDNLKGSPVVFSMVLNPVKSGILESESDSAGNITGVSLDISPELQFRKLKEVLPKIKRVGVIYNAKDKDWIKNIGSALSGVGLTIAAKPITSEADVPMKIDEISREADCLWAQVDSSIYNAQSAQYILMTLLKNKIPFMAFSAQYVKAGALLALECDYKDIGRQAADIAVKILDKGASGTVAFTFPANARLVVNKKIAELLGIDIPQKILAEAKEVY